MQKVGIVQYSQDMEVLGHFASVREAQQAYGISHVSAVCRRQRRSDGGYIWRYDDDQSPLDFSKEHWETANPDKLENTGHLKRRKKYKYPPKQGGNLVLKPTVEMPADNSRNLMPNVEYFSARSTEDYLVRIMKNYELILRTMKKR